MAAFHLLSGDKLLAALMHKACNDIHAVSFGDSAFAHAMLLRTTLPNGENFDSTAEQYL